MPPYISFPPFLFVFLSFQSLLPIFLALLPTYSSKIYLGSFLFLIIVLCDVFPYLDVFVSNIPYVEYMNFLRNFSLVSSSTSTWSTCHFLKKKNIIKKI